MDEIGQRLVAVMMRAGSSTFRITAGRIAFQPKRGTVRARFSVSILAPNLFSTYFLPKVAHHSASRHGIALFSMMNNSLGIPTFISQFLLRISRSFDLTVTDWRIPKHVNH